MITSPKAPKVGELGVVSGACPRLEAFGSFERFAV